MKLAKRTLRHVPNVDADSTHPAFTGQRKRSFGFHNPQRQHSAKGAAREAVGAGDGVTLTIRRAMESREGAAAVQWAERLNLRVWAVERQDFAANGPMRPETTMVFGKSRSDAQRRAQTPARLGEPSVSTEWRVAEIEGGWDGPVVWPLERREVAA